VKIDFAYEGVYTLRRRGNPFINADLQLLGADEIPVMSNGASYLLLIEKIRINLSKRWLIIDQTQIEFISVHKAFGRVSRRYGNTHSDYEHRYKYKHPPLLYREVSGSTLDKLNTLMGITETALGDAERTAMQLIFDDKLKVLHRAGNGIFSKNSTAYS
jgi:hypothetical protein